MSMTELERESKRFAGNVKVPWHHILATGRLLTGDYPSHLNPNCQGEWMLADIYVCACGFIGVDATSRTVESEGKWSEHAGNPNPTYTIELIRSELERARKLGDFYIWLSEEYCDAPPFRDYEVLQTPLLFLQAANAYMGRHEA